MAAVCRAAPHDASRGPRARRSRDGRVARPRAFRDKMVRKMLAEARRLRRARMRGRMQRCWRMALAKRRRIGLESRQCAHVGAARLDARARRRVLRRKGAQGPRLPVEDAPRTLARAPSSVGQSRREACALRPFEWEVASLIGGDEYEKPEEKKAEAPVDE